MDTPYQCGKKKMLIASGWGDIHSLRALTTGYNYRDIQGAAGNPRHDWPRRELARPYMRGCATAHAYYDGLRRDHTCVDKSRESQGYPQEGPLAGRPKSGARPFMRKLDFGNVRLTRAQEYALLLAV